MIKRAKQYTNRIGYKNKYERLLKKYQKEMLKSHIFETLYTSTRNELNLLISKQNKATINVKIE